MLAERYLGFEYSNDRRTISTITGQYQRLPDDTNNQM
jgi:hypothetical protein